MAIETKIYQKPFLSYHPNLRIPSEKSDTNEAFPTDDLGLSAQSF